MIRTRSSTPTVTCARLPSCSAALARGAATIAHPASKLHSPPTANKHLVAASTDAAVPNVASSGPAHFAFISVARTTRLDLRFARLARTGLTTTGLNITIGTTRLGATATCARPRGVRWTR